MDCCTLCLTTGRNYSTSIMIRQQAWSSQSGYSGGYDSVWYKTFNILGDEKEQTEREKERETVRESREREERVSTDNNIKVNYRDGEGVHLVKQIVFLWPKGNLLGSLSGSTKAGSVCCPSIEIAQLYCYHLSQKACILFVFWDREQGGFGWCKAFDYDYWYYFTFLTLKMTTWQRFCGPLPKREILIISLKTINYALTASVWLCFYFEAPPLSHFLPGLLCIRNANYHSGRAGTNGHALL